MSVISIGGSKFIFNGVMNYRANNANENSSPPMNNMICEIFIILKVINTPGNISKNLHMIFYILSTARVIKTLAPGPCFKTN